MTSFRMVIITEIQKFTTIEADTKEEAEQKVNDIISSHGYEYNNPEYVRQFISGKIEQLDK